MEKLFWARFQDMPKRARSNITALQHTHLNTTYYLSITDDTEKEQRIGMPVAPVKTWPLHQMMTVYLF